MEKKFIINRVDLGQRVTGYEVFNPAVNGGEVIGMTTKQLGEAVKAGEALGWCWTVTAVWCWTRPEGSRPSWSRRHRDADLH